MQLYQKRNYSQLLKRLKLAVNNVSNVEIIGYTKNRGFNYPFPKINIGKNNTRRVLISAGIHGDEPAGIETICKFLESEKYKAYLNSWDFTFIPCINPYGYEFNTRENNDRIDLNRTFKEDSPPMEVKLSKLIFIKSYFNLTIELHEDCDSHGYYLFQKSNESSGIELGYEIIKSVKKIIPINLNTEIDGNQAEKGQIHRTKNIKEMDWWPMAGYALFMNSNHCLTLETPTYLSMGIRVKAHLAAIDCALQKYQD